ncbi:MAG: glycosyltransferase [Candidatus Magasanikbacteria bacterium]
MKILLVNKYWYIRGGAERVVFATKDILEKNGHEVEIFGMKHPKNILENKYFIDNVDYTNTKGFKKVSLAFKSIYNRDAKNKFAKLVEDFKPDVVHFHNIYHQLSFSLLDVVKQKNIPAVMTLHDYKMISPNYNLFHHGSVDESIAGNGAYKCVLNNCLGNETNSILATLEYYFRKFKNLNNVVDKYLAPSEFVAKKHIQYGLNKNKIVVLPNPVNFSNNYILPKNSDGVLFFGRLSEEKGLNVLLEAAKKIPDIKVNIVGSGPLQEHLEKRISEEKINNISLLGYKQGRELTDLIKASRLVVVPSIWYEVSGLSILEAYQSSKLVLASDIGAISESVFADCLFPVGDSSKLAELIDKKYHDLKNQEKTVKLLKQQVLEKHSEEKYLKKLLVIYDEVCK